LKDAIAACPQFTASTPRRLELVDLQLGIEPPDQSADMPLGDGQLVSERLQFVHQALGANPTESVLTDIGLPRVVTDHHRRAQEPMCIHRLHSAASEATCTGVGRHWRIGNAEALEMAHPGFLISELPPPMHGQPLNQCSGRACSRM